MTELDGGILDRLFQTVAARRTADPATSYTATLLQAGLPHIARKLGEEAVETVIAALAGGEGDLIGESADLLYHLLVLWAGAGVAPAEVWRTLAQREGVSGIAEKASRTPGA